MNERGPGLAPSRSSGGSRAANADGAPRKKPPFKSSRPPESQSLPHLWPHPRGSRFRVARPGRIAGNDLVRPDIPRHHAAGADQGAVADGHAGQDDGAAADPDVAADPHRAAEFEAAGPRLGVARVVGGVDLHRRSDLGAVADRYLDNVEDHAIEVQEHAIAETDIIAKVAKERRPDHGAGADMSETFG